MKELTRIAEILLGIIFLGAGVNGYVVLFGFEPFAPTDPAAMEFLGDGYLLAMEKGVEIIGGFLLLIRKFVPFAIVMLAGIVVNIFAFHIFVDTTLLPFTSFVLVLEGVLVWVYRDRFSGLFER